jgi:hypothetical protein
MDFRFWINAKEVPAPDNWQGLEIECSFETEKDIATIRAGMLSWMAENAKTLNDWVKMGLGGGPGLLEGPVVQIEAGYDPNWIVVFDGCIDMTTADTLFSCDIIKAPVRENKIDWLNDIADTVSFAYLESIGEITKADYVAVPYVVSAIPDYTQVALLGISLYMMEKELEEIVEKTAALGNDLYWDAITAGTQLGTSLGSVIADIAKITFYIAYLLAIVIAMIELFRALFNNLVQPLKYKYGMKVKTLFEKACSHLNIPFSSTIFQQAPFDQLVIIPKKSARLKTPTFTDALFGNSFSRKNYDDTMDPNAKGYDENASFKELILAINDVFDSNVKIRNNGVMDILHYEVWDHFNNVAAITLPPISSEAPFEDPYGTNASELVANYFLKFQYDTTELNTLDRYDGTSYQMILKPIVVQNAKNVLLKGLTRKDLQFARANRKTDFTVPEKVVQFLYSMVRGVYNAVVSFYNGIVSTINSFTQVINTIFGANIPSIPLVPKLPQSIINNRLNAMLLQTDMISVPKLALVSAPTGKKIAASYLDPLNDTYVTAKYLMENYHSHSWAINTISNPADHNQYLTFKDKEIPLCLSDFVKIKGNNIIQDSQNRYGRIDSLRWNPHKETARIDFRVKEKWTNNLSQQLIIDGS